MQYSTGIIISNLIWCIELETNTLVSIDLNNGKTRIEKELATNGRGLMYEVIEKIDNNTILIAPFLAEDFMIYDIKSKKINRIIINWEKEFQGIPLNYKKERKIGKIIIDNNMAYAIGFSITGIIVINLSSYKHKVINCLELCNISDNNNSVIHTCYFTYKSGIKDGNKLLLPLARKPIVLEISLSDMSFEIYNIDNIEGISSICKCGNNLYCIDFNNNLLKICDNKKSKIIDTYQKIENGLQAYAKIESYNNYIYLIPYYINVFFRYDTITEKRRL